MIYVLFLYLIIFIKNLSICIFIFCLIILYLIKIRWDYFLRDSHNLGINTTFIYKRYIIYSKVIKPPNGLNQICMRDKVTIKYKRKITICKLI